MTIHCQGSSIVTTTVRGETAIVRLLQADQALARRLTHFASLVGVPSQFPDAGSGDPETPSGGRHGPPRRGRYELEKDSTHTVARRYERNARRRLPVF